MNYEQLSDAPRWYIIHTNPKQEDRADSNLRAWNVETFTPKVKAYRYNQYTGESAGCIKPLFPRYIFAWFKAGALLPKIRFTRGIHSVVSIGGTITPVEDEIISMLKSRMDADGYIKMDKELKSGDEVVITKGLLKSFTGIFEREMKDSERVMILLTSLSYQNRIIVEKEFVNKVGESYRP